MSISIKTSTHLNWLPNLLLEFRRFPTLRFEIKLSLKRLAKSESSFPCKSKTWVSKNGKLVNTNNVTIYYTQSFGQLPVTSIAHIAV